MGDLLAAACPCGYESEALCVGCGFSVHAGLVPALCRTCHQFVSVDPSRARIRCPRCRRKPEILTAFLADQAPDPSQAFECPACGKTTAAFGYRGIWD